MSEALKKTYVVFGELDLDGLGVGADWPLCVQSGVSVTEPGLYLRQGVLKLTQGQQSGFKLVLQEKRGLVKNKCSNI